MKAMPLALTLVFAPSAALAQFTTPPSSSDAIDVTLGTTVTAFTAGIAPAPEAAIGGNPGGPEPGTCFCPNVGIGNDSFIEVARTAPVTLAGARLYGKNDGVAVSFRRAMSGFRMYADTDGDGTFETNVVTAAINPDYDNEPANLATQSEYLELAFSFTATTAADWRMEFVQGTQIGAFEGVRIIEVDAFAVACPPPVAYCTSGTTTNGCRASMSSTGTPSASATSGFFLETNGVEGQKQGILFYGVSGPAAIPWSATSTSYLCVLTPIQRTYVQSSGGTADACDGAFALDWNDYVTTTPGALGTPFAGGETVWAQAWFRDPPAPRTTNLSDGLSFVVCP
jgi:hypothetical protein